MGKSLTYRLFGLRKVPKETRRRFDGEGILFDEEGTTCSLAYRNFRGTHKSSGRGWQSGMVGTLVITQHTFYVHLPFMILCDKPVEEAVGYIKVQLKGAAELKMEFEVEKLFDKSSGELTCYWHTENAPAIMRYISELQARQKS